jgi:ABC-type nitrate/sulfonate/bicarbonate transport systems, periplasmic components
MKKFGALIVVFFLTASLGWSEQVIRIGIGTQDTTIKCAAGGTIVRELHLLEKYLPHDGQYKDVKYDIVWHNFTSGAPANSEMLANKLDITNMADFPAILGASAFQAANNGVKAHYIASLSGSIRGAGNAVVVPLQSSVQAFSELKGKRISVPFGSTAHAMLLRAVQDQGWDPERDISIITQAPEVAGSALKAGQIDAHADFVPFGELFPFRGIARKIYDGSSSGVPTTHGVQVRSDFAEKYPELVVAYLTATIEASRLIREHPEELCTKLAEWTGVEPEVFYAFHGPQGIQTRDYTLKPEYVEAIRKAEEKLRILKKTDRPVNVDEFVTDRFIREASKRVGLDYDAQLKDYSPVPFGQDAQDTHAPVTEPMLAGQVWIQGELTVRLYSSPEATLSAAAKAEGSGKKIRVVYVHDRQSGIKLFADRAWFVEKGGELSAFLLKPDADKWAAEKGGSVVDYTAAQRVAATRFAGNCT